MKPTPKICLSSIGSEQQPQPFMKWLLQNAPVQNWYRLPERERAQIYSAWKHIDPLAVAKLHLMLVSYKVPAPHSMNELVSVSGQTAEQIIATLRSAMYSGGNWVMQYAGVLRLHQSWIQTWKAPEPPPIE